MSEDDEVDSDFDIDENDEPIDDAGDEEEGKAKRPRRVVTKAYKEPPRPTKKEKQSKPKNKEVSEKTVPGEGWTSFTECSSVETGKKSVRTSTKLKTEETAMRIKIATKERESKKKKKTTDNYRKLTQEELLKEAVLTEKINLASLEKYQKLELEKAKKNKVVKETAKGPRIIYLSTSMPLIESEEDVASADNPKRCARDFITFTEEETFNSYFKPNRKRPEPKNPPICLITNTKARFFDPVTQMPYSSASTFRALREAYCSQLEQLSDSKSPEVLTWIEWRKKHNNTNSQAT